MKNKCFVSQLAYYKMLEFQESNSETLKPVHIRPILNLQREVERMKDIKDANLFSEIEKYLWNLDIYIDEESVSRFIALSTCSNLHSYQEIEDNKHIELSTIKSIADQLSGMNIYHIRLIISQSTSTSFVRKILSLFEQYEGKISVVYPMSTATDLVTNNCVKRVILITFPLETSFKLENITNTDTSDKQYIFFVSNLDEVEEAQSIILSANLLNFKYHAIYNGKNKKFIVSLFAKNAQDILEERLVTMQEIFQHQKMNNNFFGKFTIMPNGDTYARVGESIIGNTRFVSLRKMIATEMEENTAWRRIRRGEPCCHCVMQYLCPSLSNYEIELHQNNICLVQN